MVDITVKTDVRLSDFFAGWKWATSGAIRIPAGESPEFRAGYEAWQRAGRGIVKEEFDRWDKQTWD